MKLLIINAAASVLAGAEFRLLDTPLLSAPILPSAIAVTAVTLGYTAIHRLVREKLFARVTVRHRTP